MEPRKSEYPPRNEEKDAALSIIISHVPLDAYTIRSSIPVLNVPRHSAHAKHRTNVCATPIVHVSGEPRAEVVPKAHRVGADIRAHHGKGPAQPRKELCGAVVPQPGDFKRVPGHAAVDDLRSGRDSGTEDAAQGHEDDEAHGLGPEHVPGRRRVAREVGHVESEGGLGPDSGGDALEEDDHDWGAVFDLSGLREGRAESISCSPAVSLFSRFPVLEGVITCNEGPNEQRQAKHRHDNRLGHEHVPQTADVQPQQRQLDQDEEKEAQHLCTRDVSRRGQAVGKVIELRPDG